ncbi:TPA_asm: hypothetical protein GYS95_12495 [Listeria monocytogenes]|nr:hypothetical protein [Listeria monocytogenes]
MNPFLVQGLLWLTFFICLYCLRRWHKHQADVTHKYKAIKFCFTVYGIYRMTYFLQEGIMASDLSIWLPSILILGSLNVLLYVQVIRLLSPKIIKVIAAFQKKASTSRWETIFFQVTFLLIVIGIWVIGMQRMSHYYSFSTVTVTLMDVWGFMQISLSGVLAFTLQTTFLLSLQGEKTPLIRGFYISVVFCIFLYCLPGWFIIFEEKPLTFYGLLLFIQEFYMYQLIKRKVQKELPLYQAESLNKVIGKLITKIK